MEWRDISSAPRDDTTIILAWNGKVVVPAIRYEGGWSNFWFDWMDPQPTHWSPLPPPPNEGNSNDL